MPRLYRATEQTEAQSFVQWSSGMSGRQWIPIQLFNLCCFAVLIVTHVLFVARGGTGLCALSIAFISALAISTLAVFIEGGSVERQVKEERTREQDGRL